jgi:hypothetical protein
MRRIIAFLLFFLLANSAFSQRKNAVVILAKPKVDGVWLRWAPADVTAWQLGNKYGYIVERFTLQPDGDLEPSSQKTLTPQPVKPYSLDEFRKLIQSSDEVSAIEELLYGEDFQNNYSANNISSVLSKTKELENRLGMTLLMCDFSIDASKAAGLFLKDANVQKDKRYIYRIRIAAPVTTGSNVEPVATVVTFTDEKPMPGLNDLDATFGNHTVTISWSTILHKGIYTAYYIEKSEDGKNFKQLSELPYVHMSEQLQTETAHFVDSLDVNQKTFYYRIKGISPFAETGPYSNVVSGEGKDNLGGFLIIREGKVIENKRIRIAWEFPPTAETQISGFVVSASNNPKGPYIDLTKKPLLKTMREFFHETAFHNTYYILRAVDKLGVEITHSYPYLVQVADETPPANPTGLQGTMDKTGVATLTWNKNTDSDMLGYRVFRSNSLHEEFVEVTKEILPKPYFIDSVNIRVLNKKIYYHVVAMDKNYNPSDYSNLLKLERPDVIAPTSPVFKKTEMKDDSIVLDWENSVSDDISKYELVRIEKEERLSRVIKTWRAADSLTHYADQALTLGKTYSYKIIAMDSAENKSEGSSREVFFETGVRKPIKDIKTLADREKKIIELSWKNENPGVKCIVYRKMNDGKFVLYKTYDGNVESFVDKNIPINNFYAYKIQTILKAGIKTRLSEEVTVNF